MAAESGSGGRGTGITLGLAVLLAALGGLTVWRITRTASNVDFLHYMAVTRALADGADLYAYTGEHITDFPPYGVFFAPFLLLPPGIQEFAFLAVNLAAASALIALTFRRAGTGGAADAPVPTNGWITAFAGVALCNTAPMMQALRQGQVSILVSLLLLAILLGGRSRLGALWLATAMMLKYSYGFFALLVLVKRGPIVCALALALFLVWLVSPVVMGADLGEVYGSYLESIERSFGPDGINNPEVHGSNLVHLAFFRPAALNWIARGLLVLGFLTVLGRERGKEGVGLPALLATAALGMAVSYHRLYDLVILVPLLGALAAEAARRRRWGRLAGISGFLLFYLVPQSIVNRVATALGNGMGESAWLLLGRDTRTSPDLFFPVHGVVLLLLCVYALYLHLAGDRGPSAADASPAPDGASC